MGPTQKILGIVVWIVTFCTPYWHVASRYSPGQHLLMIWIVGGWLFIEMQLCPLECTLFQNTLPYNPSNFTKEKFLMPVACESFPYNNRYTTFINRWALCTSYTTGTTSCWIWSLSYPEALVLHHSYRKTLNKQTVSWETSHKICKGPCLFSLTAIGLINLFLKKDGSCPDTSWCCPL